MGARLRAWRGGVWILDGRAGLELFGPLQDLVHPHRLKLDHGIRHLEPAFKLFHRVSVALKLKEHVETLALSVDAIGKPAAAHLFHFFHLPAGAGDYTFHLRDEFIGVFVGHVGPHNEHDFVIPHVTSRRLG